MLLKLRLKGASAYQILPIESAVYKLFEIRISLYLHHSSFESSSTCRPSFNDLQLNSQSFSLTKSKVKRSLFCSIRHSDPARIPSLPFLKDGWKLS